MADYWKVSGPSGTQRFTDYAKAAAYAKSSGATYFHKQSGGGGAQPNPSKNKSKKSKPSGGGGGGGLEPKANVTVEGEVTPPPLKKPEDIGIDVTQTPEVKKLIDQTFQSTISELAGSAEAISKSAEDIRKVSSSYLKGEIPADVQSQIRRVTSERGLATGLGRGQAGQALTARDLGLMSTQLQEQGVKMEAQAVEAESASSEIRSVLAGITEQRYQFDKSYRLETTKLLEDMRRTDVDVIRIEQARKQFNASQNMRLVELTAEMAIARAQVQASLAIAGVDGGGAVGGMNQVIGQLDKLIAKSSKTK